jgi:hypothetical protein
MDSGAMVAVLAPFAAPGLNVLHLPGARRTACLAINSGPELSTLDLQTTSGTFRCRPKALHFEHFPETPSESFFLLDVTGIDGSGKTEKPASMLLVAVGGLWDLDLADYDGGHAGLSSAQIRRRITRAMDFVPVRPFAGYLYAANGQAFQAAAARA